MNAFDKVIGYESIKTELLQICDMIHNKEIYINLGARMPRGILLYGDPGLGKTLMAKCFIEESGLKTFTLRRNKRADDFVDEITETFRRARRDAPAIVFLDDMDKFANEDDRHRDAEEYVAIQAGIDESRGAEVFVLATANDIDKLPESLLRSGRFDRKIEVENPSSAEAFHIIRHYLADKRVSPDVNLEDLFMMLNYSSCADLEMVLNEAAIYSGYARKSHITMQELVEAVLRVEYAAPDNCAEVSAEELRKVALHEAGHLVICEVLYPGCVGLASLRKKGCSVAGGFVRRCKRFEDDAYDVLAALGGKAAVELYYAEGCAGGCRSDIGKAIRSIRSSVSRDGRCGVGLLDVEARRTPIMSEDLNARSEAVVQAELERYLFKAREILLKNKGFLEDVATVLLEKETLLYSDIRELRESAEITEVFI